MQSAKQLYLDLLKRCLSNVIYQDPSTLLGEARPFDLASRVEGRDWPDQAHTMIGLQRLDNLHFCVEDALARGVPGDLMETGVWRGGAAILMRAILKVNGVTDRLVWAADSFEGLPPPDPAKYPLDTNLNSPVQEMAVARSGQRNSTVHRSTTRAFIGMVQRTLPSAR